MTSLHLISILLISSQKICCMRRKFLKNLFQHGQDFYVALMQDAKLFEIVF